MAVGPREGCSARSHDVANGRSGGPRLACRDQSEHGELGGWGQYRWLVFTILQLSATGWLP